MSRDFQLSPEWMKHMAGLPLMTGNWEQTKQDMTRQLVQSFIATLRNKYGDYCIITVEVTPGCHDEMIFSYGIEQVLPIEPTVTYTFDIDLSKLK